MRMRVGVRGMTDRRAVLRPEPRCEQYGTQGDALASLKVRPG